MTVTANRRIVAVTAAGVVAALLLCAIAYMLYGIFAPAPKDTVTVSEEEQRDFAARQARAARRIRTAAPDQPRAPLVPTAGIPWSRDVAQPQVAVVYTASIPWTRQPARPSPAVVAPATLPTMGAAVLDIPLELPTASVPWRHVAAISHVHLSMAVVPRLPKLRDATRPEPAMVDIADVPWVRELDEASSGAAASAQPSIARATRRTTYTSWDEARRAHRAEEHATGWKPRHAQRAGAGENGVILVAELPWRPDRNPASPLPASVRVAELPPTLRHYKPGR